MLENIREFSRPARSAFGNLVTASHQQLSYESAFDWPATMKVLYATALRLRIEITNKNRKLLLCSLSESLSQANHAVRYLRPAVISRMQSFESCFSFFFLFQ